MLTPAEQKKAAEMIDGWMTKLDEVKDPKVRRDRVQQICQTQAQINASHPDAYMGDGVKAWVTGREDALEDVKKFAEAVNMDPSALMRMNTAQRISAALNEAKWLEPAVARLRNPTVSSAEDLGKVAKDVSDIGKHGARSAGLLSDTWPKNAGALDDLFEELRALKEMPKDEIAKALQEGRFVAVESQITGTLERLRTATEAAVKELGTELKTFATTAEEMAEFQRLLMWKVRYSEKVGQGIVATTTLVRFIKAALSEEIEQSVQEPEPNKSEAIPSPGVAAPGSPAQVPAGAATG
jgi:hypothetical protein